jgi:hypothetical protein
MRASDGTNIEGRGVPAKFHPFTDEAPPMQMTETFLKEVDREVERSKRAHTRFNQARKISR